MRPLERTRQKGTSRKRETYTHTHKERKKDTHTQKERKKDRKDKRDREAQPETERKEESDLERKRERKSEVRKRYCLIAQEKERAEQQDHCCVASAMESSDGFCPDNSSSNPLTFYAK